jgi:hypothetical protein
LAAVLPWNQLQALEILAGKEGSESTTAHDGGDG